MRLKYAINLDHKPEDAGQYRLPEHLDKILKHPAGYVADEGLVEAVNTAIELGQPLLVTGEPGFGKTQLGYSIAYELNRAAKSETSGEKKSTDIISPRPLLSSVKSTSESRDLFYRFDALGYYRAAQTRSLREGNAAPSEGGRFSPLDYLFLEALGESILRANPQTARELRSRMEERFGVDRALMNSRGEAFETGAGDAGGQRSVVVIDEIDKAPRDLPNDLLDELDNFRFYVPELQMVLEADTDLRPIVVITSNRERELPAPFMRRCVYYHLELPGQEGAEREGAAAGEKREQRLDSILKRRVAVMNHLLEGETDIAPSELVNDLIQLLIRLRDQVSTSKKPSLAELLHLFGLVADRVLLGRSDGKFRELSQGVTLEALLERQVISVTTLAAVLLKGLTTREATKLVGEVLPRSPAETTSPGNNG